MTQDLIVLIKELGFPIAIAVSALGMLAWVMRYILRDKVEGTLKNFSNRHDLLLKVVDGVEERIIKEINEIKKEMHLRFDQERDDTEKIKKWCSEIKSDLKVYIDLTMKGK
tara:strand:- start:390 stop:722 length:333 start_codon:yes stop_codon:yes gene_type:complete